jgi:hypothetical protein
MVYIRLQDIVGNKETVESYILFRTIEDWCCDNIHNSNWKFDYGSTICLYGVDVSGTIIFKCETDSDAFRLKFNTRLDIIDA